MSTDAVRKPEPRLRDASDEGADPLDPDQPLAVFLVGGEDSLGTAAFAMFQSRYAPDYRQVLFVSVGVMDQTVLDAGVDGTGNFQGTKETERLLKKTEDSLRPYIDRARQGGQKARGQVSVSVDVAPEIARLSGEISSAYPKAVYFLSKLVFQKPRWFHRWLYGGTSDSIRNALERRGVPVTVLPVVIPL
ncbi:MAG TPA: hypothetical protein VKW04_10590 [Planctomycetota bacterium]|nr:hypothetical protein [Planctomycetota bacterium]